MSFWQIVLLAVGLAMDATAVAAARGCAAGAAFRMRDVLRVAFLFGLAQALMPLLGWALGAQVGRSVAAFDHWIIFVVLGVVGGKMLYESRSPPDADTAGPGFGWRVLFGLAIATSIDAFAVGLTLPLLDAPFALSIITIGVVTAVLSAAGVMLGGHVGKLLGRKLELVGGVLLILLGVKTLVEHLSGRA